MIMGSACRTRAGKLGETSASSMNASSNAFYGFECPKSELRIRSRRQWGDRSSA
jgi:hypothetical protein